jgi:hypothetical protein
LFYNPAHRFKGEIIAAYLLFLVSAAPLFTMSPMTGRGMDDLNIDIFHDFHSVIVNPIVTLGGMLSLFFQIQKAHTMSLKGLAIQGVVFALVALSWIARVKFPPIGEFPITRLTPGTIRTWYELVGWPAVDNIIFAITQLILLCATKYQKRPLARNHNLPEEEPLLAP